MLSKDFYSPPLRFATQNIEEVARSDGGVKKYPQQRKRIKVSTLSPRCAVRKYRRMPTKQKGRSKRRFYPLPLLIADEIGGVPVGRGG